MKTEILQAVLTSVLLAAALTACAAVPQTAAEEICGIRTFYDM